MPIADIARDQRWVPIAQSMARSMTDHHPALAQALIDRWMSGRDDYGRV